MLLRGENPHRSMWLHEGDLDPEIQYSTWKIDYPQQLLFLQIKSKEEFKERVADQTTTSRELSSCGLN